MFFPMGNADMSSLTEPSAGVCGCVGVGDMVWCIYMFLCVQLYKFVPKHFFVYDFWVSCLFLSTLIRLDKM